MTTEIAKCPMCKGGLTLDDITKYNRENEEGEDYCEVEIDCDCGFDNYFTNWGHIKSDAELCEQVNDFLNETYKK